MSTSIKVIPVKININTADMDPEASIYHAQVEYMVELTTDTYNNIMSNGTTWVTDPSVDKAIRNLLDVIQETINRDLGLSQNTLPQTLPTEEEDL